MQARRTFGRTAAVVTLFGAALLGSACSRGTKDRVMTADLERDLQLAIDARPVPSMVVSAIEGGPVSAPSGTLRGRRDAVPTPRRTPRPRPDAEVQPSVVVPQNDENSVQIETVTEHSHATTAPNNESSAVEPTTAPEHGTVAGRGPSAGNGEADGHGEMGAGRGRRGGGWGTVIGVIIRGGGAGIDNCEEHDRRRAGRRGGGMGGYGGGVVVAGGVLGGVIGGVIAGNGGTIRPTFPR